jgi:hypothetical protein
MSASRASPAAPPMMTLRTGWGMGAWRLGGTLAAIVAGKPHRGYSDSGPAANLKNW